MAIEKGARFADVEAPLNLIGRGRLCSASDMFDYSGSVIECFFEDAWFIHI
jgi:hypothetical protein